MLAAARRRLQPLGWVVPQIMSEPAWKYTLTRTQGQVLRVFEERANNALPPPTLRELCEKFGWASTAAARDHVRALIKKGALVHGKRGARATHLASPVVYSLPMVESPSTGVGTPQKRGWDQLTVSLHQLPPGRRPFIVQVEEAEDGCSILPNDLLIVRNDRRPLPGDVLVRSRQGRLRAERARGSATPRGFVGVVTGAMRYYPQPEDES